MGKKASFLPHGDIEKYLCCNADESEPGTFKDRELMHRNPHQLIEGVLIAAYAAGANHAFIYIRGEYEEQADILDAALTEAYSRGYVGERILGSDFTCSLVVHRGAGAYICGEETALLDSLEGKRGNPRLKPPFPANQGLYQGPTLINNVETLCNVPHIVVNGADWFSSSGPSARRARRSSRCPATCSAPATTRSSWASRRARSSTASRAARRQGRRVKAWFPGGSSAPVLTEEHLDLPYDFEHMAEAGSMLGSGAIIVVDDSVPIVSVALRLAEFYRHESCGKCVPCREGTNWTVKMLERIDRGEATPMDLDVMADVQDNIIGNCLCVLGDSMAMPVGSMIEHFRPEFEAHIEEAARRQFGSRQFAGRAAVVDLRRGRLMPSGDWITFSIDGREVRAPEGEWLLDAAKRGDVEIPYFCYEQKLGAPVGACRMCMVEVEGIPKLQTSCSTPVKDGMVVYTQTDRVKHAQNAVVEFLLVNHPLDCPVCDKGGECPLQDISYGWGPGRSRFVEDKRNFPKPIALSPLIAIDRERCILCYRCVRFSQEVAEDDQLVFLERADHTFVGTFDGHPYVAPFSGNVIELCPVGALTNTAYRFRARPWDIEGGGIGLHPLPEPVQRRVHGPRRARRAGARARQRRRRRRLAVRQGALGLPVDRRPRSASRSRWCATAACCAPRRGRRRSTRRPRGSRKAGSGVVRARRRARPPTRRASSSSASSARRSARGNVDSRPGGRPAAGAGVRALAHPDLAAARRRHRPRLRRAGARVRPARRGADLRPAAAQGGAPLRRAPGGRVERPDRARRRRHRGAALRARRRRGAAARRSRRRCSTEPRAARATARSGDAAGRRTAERFPAHAELAEFLADHPARAPRRAGRGRHAGPARRRRAADPGRQRDRRLGRAARVGRARAPARSAALTDLALLLGPGRGAGLGADRDPGRRRTAAACARSAACRGSGPGSRRRARRAHRRRRPATRPGRGGEGVLPAALATRCASCPGQAAWDAALGAASFVVAHAQFLGESVARHADVVFPAEAYAEKEGTVTHPDGRLQRLRPAIGHPGEVRMEWQVLLDLAARLGPRGRACR